MLLLWGYEPVDPTKAQAPRKVRRFQVNDLKSLDWKLSNLEVYF